MSSAILRINSPESSSLSIASASLINAVLSSLIVENCLSLIICLAFLIYFLSFLVSFVILYSISSDKPRTALLSVAPIFSLVFFIRSWRAALSLSVILLAPAVYAAVRSLAPLYAAESILKSALNVPGPDHVLSDLPDMISIIFLRESFISSRLFITSPWPSIFTPSSTSVVLLTWPASSFLVLSCSSLMPNSAPRSLVMFGNSLIKSSLVIVEPNRPLILAIAESLVAPLRYFLDASAFLNSSLPFNSISLTLSFSFSEEKLSSLFRSFITSMISTSCLDFFSLST